MGATVGKRSREKGAEAERAVALILRLLYPDAQRRVSGEEGQGENLGRDIKGTPGLCVQVKEMAAPRPLVALEEAIAARGNDMAVAFVRQSSKSHSTPFRVVMRVDDLLLLIAQARGARHSEMSALVDGLRSLRESSPNMKARLG